MTTEERRAELIQGLRDMADWLEKTPEALLHGYSSCCIDFYTDNKDEVVKLAQVGGRMDKQYWGETFNLRKKFGSLVAYGMNINRNEVCEKKVVGTKKVKQRDPEAMKLVPMVEVEEEIVEWECHSLLAPETDTTVG